MRARDDFAGAGGWDVAAHVLGLEVLGLEIDEAACATREAACLQAFPDGFPFQGTRTQIFQQIGNAVPPLLAYHVLATALDRA